MSRNVIRAIVTSNSSEDDYNRVTVKCEGIWDEKQGSPLIESVGGLPLIKDDVVYVDLTEGYEHPLILGRSHDKSGKHSKTPNGSILFDSSDGSNWTICFVKNNKFEFYNSDNVSVVLEANKLEFSNDSKVKLTIDGDKIDLSADGAVTVKAKSAEVRLDNNLELTASKAIVKADIEFTKTMKGTSPSMSSKTVKGFCQIPVCPFSGAMHLTDSI